MDLDMTKYTALLQAAKAEQDSGELKSAYETYLKAHAVVLRILEAQIIFKDKDSLKSVPENYTQLLAHAQEILRRIKDIVDQSKPVTTRPSISSASSTSIASRQLKSSASSSSLPNTRPGLTSSRPSQRSIATVSQLNKRTKKNVPMIPISPLTRQALLHSYTLSQVTQKFEQAKQGSSSQGSPSPSGSRDLASLRRLIEDVRIQKAKLDAVNTQMQIVSASTITSWDPDMIARQITIIDTQLFKDVSVPKDLTRSDRNTSSAQRCIDFEIYITHSVAHLLLLEWNTSRQQSPNSSPVSSKNHAPAPINAVAHMIKVANILLNVCRNFNGFMAVMAALASPEIKRMHKLWSGVTSKTKDSFKKLVQIYLAQDYKRCYKEVLLQKLDAFQDVGKDAIVAIPWMRYHMDDVKSIINSYLTGHESTDGLNNIVLSAPGARKLSTVSALLMQCRTNENSSQDVDGNSSSTNAKHREALQIEGLKMPLTPIWDLASLGSGDVSLQHWLLSRPFLNKQQLIDESLEIEPLFHGEVLPCYDALFGDEDDDVSVTGVEDPTQEDSFEHVVAPEHDLEPLPESTPSRPQSRPSLLRTPVSETDINDIMNELLNDDASDSKGLFDDIDSVGSDTDAKKSNRGQNSSRSPGRSHDVLQFLGIDPEDYSDNDKSDDEGGDFAIQPKLSDKGKGKAIEDKDTEDINNLLAQVKGLVHESRSHTKELDSREASSEHGQEEEFDIDSEEYIISAGRKFEPFQQGYDDDDQFNFDNDDNLKVTESTTSSSIVEGTSMLSLEALRRQLQSLDQEPESNPRSVEVEISQESVEDRELASKDIHEDPTPNQGTLQDIPQDIQQDTQQELTSKPEATSSSLETSPSSSVNPFAPYVIKKSSTESPPSTSPIISKGRRRKIQTDRTGRTDIIAGSPEADRSIAGFSPPKFHVGAVAEVSETSLEAIAARAKMSLASHGERRASDHSLVSPILDEAEPTRNVSDANIEISRNKDAAVDLTSAGSENLTEISTSIVELDKLAALFQNIDVKFTIRIDDNDESDYDDDDHDQFSCGSTRFRNQIIPARSKLNGNATASKADGHTGVEVPSQQADTIELSPDAHKDNSPKSDRDEPINSNEERSGATDKSPAGELTDGQASRTNRQRRRKAGGVINVPVPPKSLLSKASMSSLLGHGSEQLTGDEAQEVERHLATSNSSTNLGGFEVAKDLNQDPQHLSGGETLATKILTSNDGDDVAADSSRID
ncbi:hypothetical protein BGZ49_000105 [Haplosporangium sp. Z 27]|nr:hypothetical protein BGZ49_000105 [Haplosporangium sp. Z 27]